MVLWSPPSLQFGLGEKAYLIVTIICEYKILQFWDSNGFAGTNFLRYHEDELNFAIHATKGKKLNFEIHWLSNCGSVYTEVAAM